MSQAEDMDAVNRYMTTTVVKTPAAQNHVADWKKWYPALSWWDRTQSAEVWDKARARRNAFNLANATTPAESAKVVEVMATGITTEDLQKKSPAEVAKKRQEIAELTKKTAQQVQQSAAVGVSTPTLKKGSSGDAVKRWQAIIGVTADGKFGPATEAATKAWQRSKGLTADGAVGPKTWSAALETQVPVEAAVAQAPGVVDTILNTVGLGPTPVIQAPKPKPTVPRPAVASAPKPVSAAQPPSPVQVTPAAAVSPTVKPPLVATAGMVDTFTKLPLWARVTGAVVTVFAVIWGAKKVKDDQKKLAA